MTARESRMCPIGLAAINGAANPEKHDELDNEADIHSEVLTFIQNELNITVVENSYSLEFSLT